MAKLLPNIDLHSATQAEMRQWIEAIDEALLNHIGFEFYSCGYKRAFGNHSPIDDGVMRQIFDEEFGSPLDTQVGC